MKRRTKSEAILPLLARAILVASSVFGAVIVVVVISVIVSVVLVLARTKVKNSPLNGVRRFDSEQVQYCGSQIHVADTTQFSLANIGTCSVEPTRAELQSGSPAFPFRFQ